MSSPELTTQHPELMHDTATQESIRMQAAYEGQSLTAGEPAVFALEQVMAGADNAKEGLSQDLCQVVKAGDETFGIIKFNDQSDAEPKFIVSRFGADGERASIVGMFSKDKSLSVGRNHQGDLHNTTSREHFSVGMLDGKLAVVDNGSTNGTELFKPRDVQAEITQPQTPQKFGMRALKRVIGRFGKKAEAPAEIPADPLHTFENWAPKSAEVKEFIKESEKEPTSESYQKVGEMVDDKFLQDEKQTLESRLEESPHLKRMHELFAAQKAATEHMYKLSRDGKHQESDKFEQKSLQLFEQQKQMPADIQAEYRRITGRLKTIEIYHSRELAPNSPEAEEVFQLLETAPKLQDTDKDSAPFKDYAANTGESWKYVSEGEITDYLGQRIFKNTERIYDKRADKNVLSIRAEKDEPFDIPLDLVVYAQGFDSWKGRHGSGKHTSGPYGDLYEGNQRSLDTIKHYASLPSELPPVDEMRIFIQPDGKIFCDNGSGDSHRIAAAILRGDSTVKAERVSVARLKQNLI